MKVISLEKAEKLYPDAIARLRKDRDFLAEEEGLVDEYDVFVVDEDLPSGTELIFANTLDQLADEWDPVDDCWMEFLDADEKFWEDLSALVGEKS